MLPPEHQKILFTYLSNIYLKKKFTCIEDLENLSSNELLSLAEILDDRVLVPFFELLKSSDKGREIFEKLMGDHEEDNRELVQQFFERYSKLILADAEVVKHYNPLSLYLPQETLKDVALIQSRQQFFMRQTISTINEYLEEMFGLDEPFKVDEQEKAWEFYWGKILSLQ